MRRPTSTSGLVDAAGRALPSSRRASAALERPQAGAKRHGVFMSGWRPGLRSADADWLYDRNDVIARSRDVGRNEGVGASASTRMLNSAVGFRWTLSCTPNWRLLGVSYEAARELGAQIEALWETYAYGVHFTSDAERISTFGGQLRMAAAHIFNDGEALGLVEYAADEATTFRTRLRLVDPDRLSNPNGRPDTPTLAGGVEKTATLIPIAYHIREGHPYDLHGVASLNWRRWPRYIDSGYGWDRPHVLHAFDRLRAGQTRGVTRFASVLKLFRAFSKYTEATLEAAALNALFLGFVKSNAGPSSVNEAFAPEDLQNFNAQREEFYGDEATLTVDGVQMPVLGLDDEVQMQTTARDTSGYDGFTRSILRLIAAALGVTYEELSMDFSSTNYSSARAALLIAWREVLALRGILEQQLAWPFFSAWLEEAFDLGLVRPPAGAPAFHDAVDAYVEGRWRGPGRGHVDPTKEVVAAAARIEAGITTLEDEVAEYDGGDWQERLEQQARIEAKRRELGLPTTPGASEAAAGQNSPEADRERDARPNSRTGGRGAGALGRAAEIAFDPAHDAALDARAR